MKKPALVELVPLLHEALEWIPSKPWDDRTYLHKRISEVLGLPIEYPDYFDESDE